MTKFKVINKVLLDFLTPQDQIGYFITEGFIIVDDMNVFWEEPDGTKNLSINYPSLVQLYLERGDIEPV